MWKMFSVSAPASLDQEKHQEINSSKASSALHNDLPYPSSSTTLDQGNQEANFNKQSSAFHNNPSHPSPSTSSTSSSSHSSSGIYQCIIFFSHIFSVKCQKLTTIKLICILSGLYYYELPTLVKSFPSVQQIF